VTGGRRRIVDVDVHHMYPSPTELAPYLHDPEAVKYYGGNNFGILNPHGAFRRDSYPPGGGMPGSDPHFTVEQHLDAYDLDYVILNHFQAGGSFPVATAAEIASATNDWTISEWLSVDDRFLGSITISTLDPDLAAGEIRRVGTNPRMVQVSATAAPCLLGNSFMHPIYEACSELDLPFNFHVGGAETRTTSTYGGGKPSTFVEYHTGMTVPALHHVISLVCDGVFVTYPNMRVVFNEFGLAWTPFLLWRLDMEYRAGRVEVPWLQRLPSEYILDHIRFSTQPLERPVDRPQDLITLLSLMGDDRMLMFASDYPHWDFDSPDDALRGFPEDWKQRIFWDNANAFYKIEQRLSLQPVGGG
jgi:uncharacterized protein